MKTPIILATPLAYEQLVANDPALENTLTRLNEWIRSGEPKEGWHFWMHVEGGGLACFYKSPQEPPLFILTGGDGLGPPEARHLPEGRGVYPTREDIEEGYYGLLIRISFS